MLSKEGAQETLKSAYNAALGKDSFSCSKKSFIDFVMDNTHLTYKYVLFTAILSKATDENINPLCLQKGSTLSGAYDARTICHKVIVPFEQEVLEKAMGGSNEPFLNKPARFPELSKTNAVRRGNDQDILNSLCDNLPQIVTSDVAKSCLEYLLHKLILKREENKKLLSFSLAEEANLPEKLSSFIFKAMEQCFEGEMLTLLVAGTYHLALRNLPTRVEVHPVNQSGASGREISDLDIYMADELLSSNELKDKIFSEHDVKHAADKVIQANGSRMLFIKGPRAHADGDFEERTINEYKQKNFMLRIIGWEEFFNTVLGGIAKIDPKEFISFILQTARETKFKEECISYISSLAAEELGLTSIAD